MMRGYASRGISAGGGLLPFVGCLVFLFVLACVIAGAVALILWVTRERRPALVAPASVESPLTILQTRLAKGEITKEQYDQMKGDLEL
jgi:uncharacterized membrane protein